MKFTAAVVGALLGLAGLVRVDAAEVLSASSDEPRAFGYQVGDHVWRHIRLQVPSGLVLDETSLPRTGVQGRAVVLRGVERRGDDLHLDYQLFLSPAAPRTLEMPAFVLRFKGPPRDQDLRVDAWPVTVSPLAPVEVSPRRGLGELRPDTAPGPIGTAPTRWRLAAYAGAAALLLLYLAQVYVGLPWWHRRQRPFTRAWRRLAALGPQQGRAAWTEVHAALNQSAGHVLFAHGVDEFVRREPRFAPLRADLLAFFAKSRAAFFGEAADAASDLGWLTGFCRRCRDAERGAA